MNQPCGRPAADFGENFGFPPGHFLGFARVFFVVETKKVQQSMDEQNPELGDIRMPQFPGLPSQGGQANHQLAQMALRAKWQWVRKTQHIRSVGFTAVPGIQSDHLAGTDELEFNNPGGPSPTSLGESRKLALGDPQNFTQSLLAERLGQGPLGASSGLLFGEFHWGLCYYAKTYKGSLMNPSNSDSFQKIADLIQTVHRLRAPGGCPWDQAQTHQSLRQYLIEEAYEVLDVIDRINTPADLSDEKVRNAFREELGDLWLQILLHSEMVNEQGIFNIYDVASSLNEKLIRRHPHVFGEQKADSAESAFQNWEKQKAKEKASQPDASILDGVPRGLPALQRAARVLEKVTKVGFQWKNLEGPIEKIDEELGELKVEIRALETALALPKEAQPKESQKEPQNAAQIDALRKKAEGELGDLFFTLCNLAYLLKLNPEDALRGNLARFESRFRHVEKRLKENGKTPDQSSLEEMDRYWEEAKQIARQNETRENSR